MSDAAAGFVRWVFETFPAEEVQRIEANVYSTNEASTRVVIRAGFMPEGVRRRAGFKHGEVFDVRMFGLVRGDLGDGDEDEEGDEDMEDDEDTEEDEEV